MPAMTMPFKARPSSALTDLHTGDAISFRLKVDANESWIENIVRTGESKPAPVPVSDQPSGEAASGVQRHPLLDYAFTNELGQAVSLGQFRGQALAITFFFTRCPIPEYCPRLSKNFQEAAQKLAARAGAPTNWHFLSVTFDTEFDSPAVLKSYGERYGYDPARWSFVTGPPQKIAELARLSDATFERDGGFFNHNFRTLIIDATGKLQTAFPVSGDLSDSIVSEIIKAAAVTNR